MRNKKWKLELLNMLKSCIQEKVQDLKEPLEQFLEEKNTDFHDQCLILFLVGEYTRISGDHFFYKEKKQKIAELQDHIEEAAYQPCGRISGEGDGFFAENFGMAYGALYNSNLFGKREKTAEAIHQMKNYAYDHYTCAGKLVDEKHGDLATPQLLWICVPFGLFTPEDLVLVAAVQSMEKTTAHADLGMLGWYYAEKADYRKARKYLGMLKEAEGKDEISEVIEEIIEAKLKIAGMLSEEPLIHVLTGNFNRYEHQNYERDPWFPKAGEKVALNVAAWPVKYPEEIFVYWKTDKGRSGSEQGIYQPEYENYRFEVGSFKGGEQVTYYFQAGTCTSEEYQFTVQKKDSIRLFGEKRENENGFELELCSEEDNIYLLKKTVVNGVSMFQILPGPCEKAVGETEWKPLEELEETGLSEIREIYFWKEKDRIFSTGICTEAEKGEGFYGFGERYNHINQRGNLVDVYVYNQYKDQGIRTYMPMPYFLSSEGYGIFLPTDHYTEFDLCSTEEDSWKMEAETEGICWYRFNGTPKEMIGQFTGITGRPAMLPEWAFGPWMSSNNWDSEAEVRRQVELTKKYDIPATVLVIEAWSDEATYYIFNDAVYEENSGKDGFSYSDFQFPEWGKWPDPKGMVKYLHENGLKCILWQIPIIKYINSLHHIQKDRDEGYALEHGYCAKKKDGTPYRMPEGWFTDSLLMDYTSSEAASWWMDKRKYLVDEVQIDGFKTDGGEFVFGDEVQFADGRTGKEMRNEYPNLYIREHYQYIHEKRNGIVFSRAGFTGASQMPAHWAGDEKSTFSAFKRNLCAGLNAGISGVPFWGWDLAGFSGEIPSAELFARSAAMAAFCPIMQYHAESKAEFNQDRTPWNIAERRNAPWVLDVYRYYAKLRMALLPYIMEEAEKSVKTGVPLMRALWLEYPEDKKAGTIYDEYLFGDDLLVAPVVEEGKTERKVYIPRGSWKHLFTGEEFEGARTVTLKAEINEIIVLQKKEARWEMTRDENGEFQLTRR